MKNILITGGAGFIGSNLALTLIERGYKVSVLDNLSKQIHGDNPIVSSPIYNNIIDKVEFFEGTVTKKSDWEKALKNQNAVIHFAAETGTGQSMYQIKHYTDVNIGGTSILLDSIMNSNNKIQKLIIASSRALYGEGQYKCSDHGLVFPNARRDEDMSSGNFECKCPKCDGKVFLEATSEDSKIHPSSIYGITKHNQEQMIMAIGKSLKIPTVSFRYQNVYGPGQSLSNPYTGILSIFSNQFKKGEDVNIFEDGKESRDFVFIDDVVEATIRGLENEKANYNIFNVGSGKKIDVFTIAEELKKNYNSSSNIIISGKYRLGDIRHNYANIEKIEKTLGFKPKTTFEEGIKLFCSWVNEQKIGDNHYNKSLQELKERGLYK